jgi:hypothetical protein
MTKACSKCGEIKSHDDFSPYKPARSGLASWCKACCRAQARERYKNSSERQDYLWGYKLRKYGMTVEDYESLEDRQSGVCAICLGPPVGKFRKLHVDHCHKTGKVRGLLCNKCNTAIGFLGDDPELAKRAINYLEE